MRPRLKMEILNDALRDMGELILSRIKQFYTEPRQIAVTREDGSGSVDFHEIYSDDLDGIYEIDVDVGSSLPSSQTLVFQQAITLNELRLIDGEAVLEAIEWPKRDRILKRMKEQEAEEHQKQMELTQIGGQPQPRQGPPPPSEWSMRQPKEPPPPPPENIPPEISSGISQAMEQAAAGGAEMPPELQRLMMEQ
jgi:hypothetical protein